MRSYDSRPYGSSSSSSQSQKKAAAAEKNQQILKTLLSDPSNKFCADCKTTGHPRWASWNIGIFLCIRCSGIHRSLGTHISRVRSVDLDSWSDEQIANMIKWGNKRANLYWEHKLPENYVPTDNKIANFIRTKYDLKRWIMSSEIPDPSTLEGAAASSAASATSATSATATGKGPSLGSDNDTTPLAEVQRQLTRGSSRPSTASKAAGSGSLIPDLLGGDFVSSSASTVQTRPTTVSSTNGGHSTSVVPPPVPAKPSGTAAAATTSAQAANRASNLSRTNSLLGELGDLTSPVSPTGSVGSNASANANISGKPGLSRPDLKKSILSLYAPQNSSNFDSLTQSTANMSLGSTFSTPMTTSASSSDPFAYTSPPSSGGGTAAPKNDIFASLTNPSYNQQRQQQQQQHGHQSFRQNSATSFSSSSSHTSHGLDILSGASAWASTPTQHPVSNSQKPSNDPFEFNPQKPPQQHQRQPSYKSSGLQSASTATSSNDDEWDSFSSAPPLGTKPGLEDDVFANVWK